MPFLLNRNPKIWMLIFLAALFATLNVLNVFFDPYINQDGILYINSAKNLIQGDYTKGLQLGGKLPLYPVLLAILYFLFDNWLWAGKFLSIIPFYFSLIPLYLIIRKNFSDKSAFWGTLAFALSPFMNEMTGRIVREPFFCLFFLFFLLFLNKAFLEEKMKNWFFSSLLLIVSATFRLESIFILVGLILIFTFKSIFSKDRFFWAKRAFYFSLPIFLIGLLFLPLYNNFTPNLLSSGTFMFFDKIFEFEFFENYKVVASGFENLENKLPNGQWSYDAASAAKSFLPVVYLLSLLEASFSAFFPLFGVIAIFGMLNNKNKFTCFLKISVGFGIVYFLTSYLFLILNNFLSLRYLMVPLILLFPFVGLGIKKIIEKTETFCYGNSLKIILVFLIVFVPAYESFKYHFTGKGMSLLKSGTWISNSRIESGKILLNDERIALYADILGEDYAVFHDEDLIEICDFAKTNDYQLIAYEFSSDESDPNPGPNCGFSVEEIFSDWKHKVALLSR